jgi:2-polyprenyl-6-methoxyphenol hydroxylase-like FAD-dependent oxidoreductase
VGVAQVVIAGGGVVGLLTSLMVARDGHDVVVVERDGPPPFDAGPDGDFADWARPGVPQAVHAHTFLGRAGRVLREGTPDLLPALLARGITAVEHAFGAGFEDDVALEGRRLVLEGVIRRVVDRHPGVEILSGEQLVGLEARHIGGRIRVTGVRTADREVIRGDLVVDALGRRSPAPRWLRELEAAPPVEQHQPCGIHYFARHYRVRDGARLPDRMRPLAEVVPYGVFIVFGGDNGTFSLAGGLSSDDPHRAVLRDPEVFDRVLAAIPSVETYLEVAEPITDVHLMGALANRHRRLVVDGRPSVDGYVLVGDASLYTNATFGQGIALGFWQAQALIEALRRAADPGRIAYELETWTVATLKARFDEQARMDAATVDIMSAGARGAPLPDPPAERRPQAAAMRLLREEDPVVAPAVRRVRHLLTDWSDLHRDDAVQQRIQDYLDTDPSLSVGYGVLPRAEFERMVLTSRP